MTPGENKNPAPGPVAPALLEAAADAAAMPLTAASLTARFGPRTSWRPAAGQLWRAVYADVNALVMLLAVGADTVTAAPLTTEPIAASGDVVALTTDATALGVPVTVCTRLARDLPLSVLDRPVDDLGADLAARLLDHSAHAEAADDTENPLAVDPLTAAVAADLEDDLDLLADLSAPETPPLAAGADSGIDLDTVGPEDLDRLAARLGIGLPALFELIDGLRPLTPDQAQVFKEVLGALPTPESFPPALVLELHQPRWRALVRQRARLDHRSETDARAALTQDVLSLAARQTGQQEPSWPDRIRRWADAQGLDPDADA